jgi:glycosyltransferase 2 family protein
VSGPTDNSPNNTWSEDDSLVSEAPETPSQHPARLALKRLMGTAAKLLISCGLIYYLAAGMDWQELGEVFVGTPSPVSWAYALRRVMLLLAAPVLFFVISNFLGALQWFLLLRIQGLVVKPTQALVYYFVGIFFNNVLLGNIGGDAMRIYDISRLTGQAGAGAAATIMDRFVGLFSTCTLALLAYPVIAGADRSWVVSVLLPVWLGLVAVLTMGLSRRLGGLLEHGLCRVMPGFIGDVIRRMRRAVVVYREHLSLLAVVWLISLGVQFCRILVYFEAGRAVGMDPGLVYFICFQPVAAIIAALPISIGGLGVREGTLVGLFGGIGVAPKLSLAMSLLGYVAGIMASLLGGIAFVLRRVEPQE